MMWPKALLSASMQVLTDLLWVPPFFFILLSNMSTVSSEIEVETCSVSNLVECVYVHVQFSPVC